MSIIRLVPSILILLSISVNLWANDTFYRDQKHVIPRIESPVRGTLQGTLGDFGISKSGTNSGNFVYTYPMDIPSLHGSLDISFAIAYSSANPISFFGNGWSVNLSLTRSKIMGEIDYQTDDLNGIWGRLVLGEEGCYYSTNSKNKVKVCTTDEGGLVAYLSDGKIARFNHIDSISNEQGTYRWYLSSVTNLHNQVSEVTYESNSSGLKFPKRISWGGYKNSIYMMEFGYRNLENHIDLGFRSGTRLLLDRIVQKISFKSRNSLLYSYSFGIKENATYGAYLTWIQKLYPNSVADKKMFFSYDQKSIDSPVVEKWQDERYNKFFGETGFAAFDVSSSFVDFNQDSLIDIEYSSSRKRYIQLTDGLNANQAVVRSRPNTQCIRPGIPENRYFVDLLGSFGPRYTVTTNYVLSGNRTKFFVCDESGVLVEEIGLPGNYNLGQNVRIADINRDSKPDIFKLVENKVIILKNISTESEIAFSNPVKIPLDRVSRTDHFWLDDLNGDQIIDLIVRRSETIKVFFGKGSLEFTSPEFFRFHDGFFPVLPGLDLTLIDINHDGIKDAILSSSKVLKAFLRKKGGFYRIEMPNFSIDSDFSGLPIVGRFSPKGRRQLAVPDGLGKLFLFQFSVPSSGLLTEIIDENENKIEVMYSLSPIEEGSRQAQVVLDRVSYSVAGEGTSYKEFTFASQANDNKFGVNLGYLIKKTSDQNQEQVVKYRYDLNGEGIVSEDSNLSKKTLIKTSKKYEYESAIWSEVPSPRLIRSNHLKKLRDQILEDNSIKIGYDGICASRIVTDSYHGKKEVKMDYVLIPELSIFPSCTLSRKTIIGRHDDSKFDFEHTIERRNFTSWGSNRELVMFDGSNSIMLERKSFDELRRVRHISINGYLPFTFTYSSDSPFLISIEDSNGVVNSLEINDIELKSKISKLRGREKFEQFFTYDGKRRLETLDNNLSTSSNEPLQKFSYQLGDRERPIQITANTIVPGLNSYAIEVGMFSGSGKSLSTLTQSASGWNSNGVKFVNRGDIHETEMVHLDSFGNIENMSFQDLYHGNKVAFHQFDSSGMPIESQQYWSSDVIESRQSSFDSDTGYLLETITDAAGYSESTGRVGNKVIEKYLPSGSRYLYRYDVLGRVRGVIFPGGKYDIFYNNYGLLEKVDHSEVGSIKYIYNINGELSDKVFYSVEGEENRRIKMTYDDAGRLVAHQESSAEKISTYRHQYDNNPTSSELGFLKKVSGPTYAKEFVYRSDGAIDSEIVSFDDEMSLVTSYELSRNGTLLAKEMTLANSAGNLDQVVVENEYNRFGQLEFVLVNDNVFRLKYEQNRISEITLPSGSKLKVGRDKYSTSPMSISMTKSNRSPMKVAWSYNNRGLQENEQTSWGYSDYSYSSNGFLTLSSGTSPYGYKYVNEQREERLGVKTDILGRVTKVNGMNLVWGPSGRVEKAFSQNIEIELAYDEAGSLITKRRNGKLTRGYVDDLVVSEEGISFPVVVSGIVVGIWHQGRFIEGLTDSRQSIRYLDKVGHLEMGPYGERSIQSDLLEIVDFAGKGSDPDLGLIRMGARYYSPELGRFISPDPLFLERPELCVESPISCNLYSYAKNNPLKYVDPTGNIPILAPLAILTAPFIAGSAVYEGIVAHQQATNPEMGAKLAEGRSTFHGTMLGGAALANAPVAGPAAAAGATKLGTQAATAMTDVSVKTYVMGSSAISAAGNKVVDALSQPWASNAVNRVANMTQAAVARVQQGITAASNYVMANPHSVADRANGAVDFIDNLGIPGFTTGSPPESGAGAAGAFIGNFNQMFDNATGIYQGAQDYVTQP